MKRSLLVLLFLLISAGAFAQYMGLFQNSRLLLREPADGCTTLEEWLAKNTRLPSDAGNSWKYNQVFLRVKVDSITGRLLFVSDNLTLGYFSDNQYPRSMVREAMLKALMAPPIKLKENNSYKKEYNFYCPIFPDDLKIVDKSIIAIPAIYGDAAPGDYSALGKLIAEKASKRESKLKSFGIVPLLKDAEIFDTLNVVQPVSNYQPVLPDIYKNEIETVIDSFWAPTFPSNRKIAGIVYKTKVDIVLHVDSTGAIDINRYYNYAIKNLGYVGSSVALYFLKEINPKFTPAKDKDGNSIDSDIILRIEYYGYGKSDNRIIRMERNADGSAPSKEQVREAFEEQKKNTPVK